MCGQLIAVTGADGWVGQEVCAWLVRQGYAVRRLTRSGKAPDSIALDLSANASSPMWRKAVEGCIAVVHCAAHVHRPTESAGEQQAFREINAIGTERLIAACEAANVQRFVFASTIAVYGWDAPRAVRSEVDPVRPATAYGRSKLEAERVVQSSRCDWRIARLATVYGVDDRANFSRLAVALSRKRFIIPGKGLARKSVLPVTRAGELLGQLATLSGAQGSIVNLAAPQAPSLDEICLAFCSACGFPRPRHAPLALLRAVALAGDGVAAVGVRIPLTTDILDKLTTDTVVDVARMQSLVPGLHWESFQASLRMSSSYYSGLY